MKKRTAKRSQKSSTPKTEPEIITLEENAALRLALAQERAEHAITLAKQRDGERATILEALLTQYAEGGKFKVLEINPLSGTVKRVPAAPEAGTD